jgi:ABC-type uncharacterized transport system permease subunit
MLKNILVKNIADIGAFLMVAPVSGDVIVQILIALGIVVINTILIPLINVMTAWLKWKLKKHLPEEIHDEIDLIGKKTKDKK